MKLTEGRQTEDSLIDNTQIEKSDSVQRSDDFKAPSEEGGSRKRHKPNELELRMLKAFESSSQPNQHLSFFNGIIPSLETFNDNNIIQFQTGVLQLMENIKRKQIQQDVYQSPSIFRVQTPYQINANQQFTARTGPPCTGTENQFYTNFGQKQSALSPPGNSHSDGTSPAFSTSSNNTDVIEFATL
jgi:hypothetical protein